MQTPGVLVCALSLYIDREEWLIKVDQIKNSETLKRLLDVMDSVQIPVIGMQSSIDKMVVIVESE